VQVSHAHELSALRFIAFFSIHSRYPCLSSSSSSSPPPLHHIGHMVGSCLNAASAASPAGIAALTAAISPWMERLDYLAAVYVLSMSSPAFPLQHSLSALAVIDQPQLVRAHVAALLPHARDPSIGVSIYPHEWHSLINYLCASCLEASADESIVDDVQQQLLSANICSPFATHFRSATPFAPSCAFVHPAQAFLSSTYSFFLPPPAVLIVGARIDDASSAIHSSHPHAHWMRLWHALYASPIPQGQSAHLAPEVTNAMISAASPSTGHCAARGLDLSALFEVHPASRSLFAVMT
jgi:hypothetical protein